MDRKSDTQRPERERTVRQCVAYIEETPALLALVVASRRLGMPHVQLTELVNAEHRKSTNGHRDLISSDKMFKALSAPFWNVTGAGPRQEADEVTKRDIGRRLRDLQSKCIDSEYEQAYAACYEVMRKEFPSRLWQYDRALRSLALYMLRDAPLADSRRRPELFKYLNDLLGQTIDQTVIKRVMIKQARKASKDGAITYEAALADINRRFLDEIENGPYGDERLTEDDLARARDTVERYATHIALDSNDRKDGWRGDVHARLLFAALLKKDERRMSFTEITDLLPGAIQLLYGSHATRTALHEFFYNSDLTDARIGEKRNAESKRHRQALIDILTCEFPPRYGKRAVVEEQVLYDTALVYALNLFSRLGLQELPVGASRAERVDRLTDAARAVLEVVILRNEGRDPVLAVLVRALMQGEDLRYGTEGAPMMLRAVETKGGLLLRIHCAETIPDSTVERMTNDLLAAEQRRPSELFGALLWRYGMIKTIEIVPPEMVDFSSRVQRQRFFTIPELRWRDKPDSLE